MNPNTGKADILCLGCCECGTVLQGGADDNETSSSPIFHAGTPSSAKSIGFQPAGMSVNLTKSTSKRLSESKSQNAAATDQAG